MPNSQSAIRNPHSALRPPQFGLRTLLVLVTACCVAFALARWLHPAAVALVAFLGVSVFCHIAGNAIGTRLREIGDLGDRGITERQAIARPRVQDFAPVTQLGQRRSLGWIIIVATSVGITAGAVGGGLFTFLGGHGPVELANIAVGVIAFAFLGGLASFAAVGFIQVLGGAIWQALHGERET